MFDQSGLFLQLPTIVKARTDGDRRLIEVEASCEQVDSEGDVIMQEALLGSADSFVKSGALDLDHISEIGDRLGIARPTDYIIGNPTEVKDLGGGRTGVVGEIRRGWPKADEFWDSLTANPPVRWKASIYGFPLPGQLIDCRVTKADNPLGATRFIVKGLSWRSLALTRNPICTGIQGHATIITAKSMMAVMKAMPQFGGDGLIPDLQAPLIASPRTDAELRDHFFNHIAVGKCQCAKTIGHVSQSEVAEHFKKCCGDSEIEALWKTRVVSDLIKADRSVRFYPFSKSESTGNGADLKFPPSTMRQVKTMPSNDTAQLSLAEKFVAFLKGESVAKGEAHGGLPGSDKISGIKMVGDIFTDPNGEHSIPSRSEIVTGAPEQSSGGGAVRMVARYSDPSVQGGLTALYERFDGIMREFQKAQAATDARITKNERATAALINMVGDVVKAVTPAAPTAPAEDSFFGKAEQKLTKARKALRKAEMEEDETEREERKASLTAVADTLKSVLKLLVKAEDEDEKADDDKMEKAVAAAKALQVKVQKALDVIKAEEDKEKEEEAAKAAAAKKAGGESSAEEEKEDDTARKAALDNVEKALSGLALEVTTVKGLMETIAGQASRVAPPPVFSKANTEAGQNIEQRVDEAMDSGSLSDGEGHRARTLVQRLALAKAGRIPMEQVQRDIAESTPAVRQIFQAAA